MTHGHVRRFYWVDAWDLLADGLIKGRVDRTSLHNISNDGHYEASHEALVHDKRKYTAGSATNVPPAKEGLPEREE